MEKREYTISVLTEDKPGLLNKLTIILSRRKININSLNVSTTEVKGVSRFTIVATATKIDLEKVVKQIRKLVDVLGSFLYEEDQIYYQEIALYKLSLEVFQQNGLLEKLIRQHGAKIIAIEDNQIVIEKTGTKQETHELYEVLEPYDILEFARSGRVAISKSKRRTEAFIHELETSQSNTLSIKEF
ncbi:acetolactate synthase, small subunit [Ekhidna lutea]|uniref:Acetolactate synthase small subunit n=1 Tax=Ekhidna lutea TaxID=447679 RepID=A0A239IZZ8_EKHLU|nr:acetolactate synthase small subunit [Ekhidna lutea]SNS98593.1 acetolactate synthase, small subunit [Ekhidna lutea]